ncbi:MAG: hypothetical protein DME21_08980 [Verrucomicrobia bacterium]|nr:MAG: hypothetical protein DME21_08980 [Verrucomicrobiota bacterium]
MGCRGPWSDCGPGCGQVSRCHCRRRSCRRFCGRGAHAHSAQRLASRSENAPDFLGHFHLLLHGTPR